MRKGGTGHGKSVTAVLVFRKRLSPRRSLSAALIQRRRGRLGSMRNKEAAHSDRRDHRRRRASLVCKLSGRRREPWRCQRRGQSGPPHPDLACLRRDRFLSADGSRYQFGHWRRVLGRIAGDSRRARWHGPIGRHPGAPRGASIGRAGRRRDNGPRKNPASRMSKAAIAISRAHSLAPRTTDRPPPDAAAI